MSYFTNCLTTFGTGMWVNNPTPQEAVKAIADGALGCTTNPTFAARMMMELPEAKSIIAAAKAEQDTAEGVEAAVQRACLKTITPPFADLWTGPGGTRGWVSIQGNPFLEDDPDNIINEARLVDDIAPNAIAKIPVTGAGLKAIDVLVRENRAILATEVFAMSQVIAVAEAYQKASQASGYAPALFITHITGIYDEYLGKWVESENYQVDPYVLGQAGTYLAKAERQLMRRRGYPGLQMGGGVRGMQHWTGMVGGDQLVTMNPSTINDLIALNPPVADRFNAPEDPGVLRELMKIPDFAKAYDPEAMIISDFEDFGPVRLFRSMFEGGWERLRAAINS